jgi:hypothetical protein
VFILDNIAVNSISFGETIDKYIQNTFGEEL